MMGDDRVRSVCSLVMAPMALVLSLLVLAPAASRAQPGSEPYPGSTPQPEPQPQPQPQPGQPLPTPAPQPVLPPLANPANNPGQPLVIEMSEEERETLLRGEIGLGPYIVGGILSYPLGFGIGQAVQGRWSDTGWVYTLGDVTSLSLFIYGVDACFDRSKCGTMAIGLIGLGIFRVVQVVDAWAMPPMHNRRVRDIRQRYRIGPYTIPYRADLHVTPTTGGGFTGGFSVTF